MPIEDSKVFISYSRTDINFALKLGKDLKAKGINVWVDKLDIKPGEIWDNAVEEAMKSSGKVLIILSPASVTSLNVMDELSYAFDEGKMIIPVMYLECDRPFRLRRRHFCDFTKDFEDGFNDLLRAFEISENIIKAKSIGNMTNESAEAIFKAEEEKSQKSEEQEYLKKETDAKKKAEEEKRLQQEEELKRKAEEQEQLKWEQEFKEKAEREKRRKEETEAKRKLEEQEQVKKEEDVKKKTEEEQRLNLEEELKGKAHKQVRLKSDKNPNFGLFLFIICCVLVVAFFIWIAIYYAPA